MSADSLHGLRGNYGLALAVTAGMVAVGAAAYYVMSVNRGGREGEAGASALDSSLPISKQPISDLRKQAISALHDVLPAKAGAPGKLGANAAAINASLADPASIPKDLPKGFSNCGDLPGWLSRALALADGGTQSGVEGVRTRAKARGAWVEAKPGLPVLPKPGDIYGLSDGPRSILTHVGVIVDLGRNSDGSYWLKTADSGQGVFPNWEANFVTRTLDISGPRSAAFNRTRYLAGWLNLDAWEK